MDRGDAERILRRERGEDSAAVEPIGVESAKIGLHPRVAAGIASGDGETAWIDYIVHRGIISHRTEETVGVFVGDFFKLRGGDAYNFGCLIENIIY